jgi:hypothetical protein
MFRRRSTSSERVSRNNSANTRGSGFTGIFGGNHNNGNVHHDPSILAARQKVSDAEQAERAADRALASARNAVREAKEHVKRIEREAKEEYVLFCILVPQSSYLLVQSCTCQSQGCRSQNCRQQRERTWTPRITDFMTMT